jgi:hypothetical protein
MRFPLHAREGQVVTKLPKDQLALSADLKSATQNYDPPDWPSLMQRLTPCVLGDELPDDSQDQLLGN